MAGIYILSALVCLYILWKDKSHLPGIIILAAIAGVGPGIQGRFFLDEILICTSILFVMLTSWRDFWQRLFRLRTQLTWIDAPFLAMCLYYTLQGVRTALMMDAPLAAVIGGINLYLAGIYLVLRMYDFPAYCLRQFAITWHKRERMFLFADIVLMAVTLFNVVYICQGLFIERVLGAVYTAEPGALGRFSNQGIWWSGSAYAVMPSLLGLYIGGWRFPEKYTQFFVFLGVLMITGICFDSRVALLLFGLGGLIVLWRLQWRSLLSGPQLNMLKTGIPILILSLALSAYANIATFNFQRAVETTVVSTTFLATPTVDPVSHGNAGDYGRYLHFYAGFRAIDDSVTSALFGHGLMSNRILVGPTVLELLREDPDLKGYEDSVPMQRLKAAIATPTETEQEAATPAYARSMLFSGARTTSFTAMLIDGGYVGMGLFGLSLLAAFYQCTKGLWYLSWHNHRLALSMIVFGMAAMWPVIIFVVDLTLYWVMVMPLAMAAMLPRQADTTLK